MKEKHCNEDLPMYEASVSFKKSKEVDQVTAEERNKNVRSKLVSIGKSVVPQELKEDIVIPSDEDED